jgi:hypothetical protein
MKEVHNTVIDPRSLTNIANVLFTSCCILGFVVVMLTSELLKHVADVLNSKVVFCLKKHAF